MNRANEVGGNHPDDLVATQTLSAPIWRDGRFVIGVVDSKTTLRQLTALLLLALAAVFILFAISEAAPADHATLRRATILLLGLMPLYAALRLFTLRTRIEIGPNGLVFIRGTLPPRKRLSVGFAAFSSVASIMRPPDFWHPATIRGFPAARPWTLAVAQTDKKELILPLELSASAAELGARAITECVRRMRDGNSSPSTSD